MIHLRTCDLGSKYRFGILPGNSKVSRNIEQSEHFMKKTERAGHRKAAITRGVIANSNKLMQYWRMVNDENSDPRLIMLHSIATRDATERIRRKGERKCASLSVTAGSGGSA